MKVLVTGGTGFVGPYVLRELAATGHEIRCLVRPTSDTRAPAAVNAELVTGDVTNAESVRTAVAGCDAVIHAANVYDFWLRRTRDFQDVNVEGTRNVMEAALEAGVRKVVHVSSLVVYGRCADEIANEQSVAQAPRASRYSKSKAAAEAVAWELHRTRSLPLVVVYPGAVTGADDDKPSGRYIEAVVRRRMPAQVLVKSGLSWVHARDVARVIVRALEKEGNVGERYFAAAEWLSFADFNRIIAEASGVRLPRLVMPNAMLFPASAMLSLLGRLFGFAPMLGMSLDQMRTMRNGFRATGEKAARELGIRYEPVAGAVAEAVAAMRHPRQRVALHTAL